MDHLSPFAHPDYLALWLEILGPRTRPRVIAAWNEGELAGYAPFMEAAGTFGGFPVSTLRFIGNNVGYAGDVMYSDIAASQPREGAVKAILSHAKRSLKVRKWDLGYLHPHSPTGHAARDLLGLLESDARFFPPLPYVSLELPPDWDTYIRGLSRNTRKGNTRRLRNLKREGKVEFRDAPDPESASRLLEDLMREHDQWWKGTPREGLWGDANVQRFTVLAIRKLSRQVQHVVFTLELDGTAIGWNVGAISGNRYFSLMSSYDPQYAVHSPGQILSLLLLRHLVSLKIRRVELGPGWNERKRVLGGQPTEFPRILGYPGWLHQVLRLRRLWARGRGFS